MDKEPDLTGQDPEAIRQQIDHTRSSLTSKLETLEQQVRGTVEQVRGTVQEAKTTVQDTLESVKGTVHETVETVKGTVHDTVETVKGTVQDTVQSMKRTFDLKYQVAQHPLTMVGGSVVTGFVLGSLLPSQRREGGWTAPQAPTSGMAYPPRESRSQTSGPVREVSRVMSSAASGAASGMTAGAGLVGKVMEQFAPEIHQVKEAAIGALFGLIRDLIKDNVPPAMVPQVEKIVDDITVKAGGKPFAGPIVEATSTTPDHHPNEPRRSTGYANPVL
jgi:ElaB/YqjD/DUF883 family membrane-anchored ribosome-binding protein